MIFKKFFARLKNKSVGIYFLDLNRMSKPRPPVEVLSQVATYTSQFNGVVREMIELARGVVNQPRFQEEYKEYFSDFNLISGLMLEAIKHDELKPMSLGGPYLYKYKEYFKKNGPDWMKADLASEIDPNNPQRTALMALLNVFKQIYGSGGFSDQQAENMRRCIRKMLKFYSQTCVAVNNYSFW